MKQKFQEGQRFGMLTLIQRTPVTGRKTWWKVRCDCGKVKEIRTDHIASGASRSCGCNKYGVHARRMLALSGPAL